MFEGSEHHNVLYHDGIDKIGGVDNGSTSEDATNYWEYVPSNYLERMLWMEADGWGICFRPWTRSDLIFKRDVIKNERREGVDNQPYGKVDELLLAMLYPKNHPYSWSLSAVWKIFRLPLWMMSSNSSRCITHPQCLPLHCRRL